MAFVYWIHLPEHTNMLTDGYIGYTSKSVAERYKKHIRDATTGNKRNYRLHNAVRKYGDSLIVSTIIEGSEDYCLLIEEKLRCEKNIGWNHNIGGVKPPGRTTPRTRQEALASSQKAKITLAALPEEVILTRRQKQSESMRNSESARLQTAKLKILNTGKICSDDHKSKVSAALKGRTYSDDHKNNIRAAKLGTSHSVETKNKISASKKNNMLKPWDHVMANMDVWLNADSIFSAYISNSRCGHKKLKRLTNSQGGLFVITKAFENGWVPADDQHWLNFVKEYNKQKECNESTFAT